MWQLDLGKRHYHLTLYSVGARTYTLGSSVFFYNNTWCTSIAFATEVYNILISILSSSFPPTAHAFLYGYYQFYINLWPYELEMPFECKDRWAHSKTNGLCYAAIGGRNNRYLWIFNKIITYAVNFSCRLARFSCTILRHPGILLSNYHMCVWAMVIILVNFKWTIWRKKIPFQKNSPRRLMYGQEEKRITLDCNR